MSVSISVRDLLLTYPAVHGKDFAALRIARLDVPSGSSLAVIGTSGSGKTSLLYVLSGLERPQRGTVRVGEVEVTALAEAIRDDWRRRTVGLVFQDFHLLPGLDALGNVLLPATFDGLGASPALRRRGLDLLARVGIRDVAQPVETLSRGEMQRVAVARALLFRPALLLADEPTASLDAAAAAVVTELLLELRAENDCTLIVVTHDRLLAERLDAACHLDAGRVLEPQA